MGFLFFNGGAVLKELLSVIVPCYNEQEVLEEFHERLSDVLRNLDMRAEIVFVNDGSKDRSLDVIRGLKEKDGAVALLDLSRNFGKEIAMTAGLDYAKGDAVIIIDTDLQDPPELIPELIKQWKQGFDVVYAKRTIREGETFLKKFTAKMFYKLMSNVGQIRIPENTGDFRLLSRRAVDSLKQLREKNRFMKGLFTWIGFPQIEVLYKRDARKAGKTSFNYWKLWNFALTGITSFTAIPLKLASYLGFTISIGALIYAVKVVIKALLFKDPVAGYPSMMAVILFLGGVQLMSLGIMGEYIGRLFDETKGRPLYFVNNYFPSKELTN